MRDCARTDIGDKAMHVTSMQELWAELTPNQREWIINTWHTSKVHSHKRYDRLQYVCYWFVKEFGGIWTEHPSGLYKIVDQLTTV